uniref:Uncharacterized protein n=1 Tax=Ciona savignyi TaxID=51511 RepID=H2ZEJ1_CIOSA
MAVAADQLKLSSLGGAIIIVISSHECFTYYKEKLRNLFAGYTEDPRNSLLVINCWNSVSKQQVSTELNLSDLPVQYHVINFKDMDYISNEQQLIRGIEISSQSILPTALTCASLREVIEQQISLRYIKPVMRHCGLREQLSMPPGTTSSG